MKKMLIPICLPVFLSSILVGCIAGSGNKKPEGSKSTDTSFPEAEPSTNETEPSSAPGESYAETSSETEKNRNPVYIATAPEWPSETEEPENAEYDPTRYVDLVIDNPQVFFSASTVEASGTPQALGPYYCFDGKADTRWSTVFHDLYESWIAVDFGRTVTVSGYIVNEVTNWGHVTSYSVQVMEDGAWKTVYDGTTFPAEPDQYIALPSSYTTSGFRLLFHDGETMSETVTISEIFVFGRSSDENES